MPETRIVLIFVLVSVAMVLLAWLTLFSVVSAKSRIIQEQRKALEAEQRLRRSQEAFADNAHHELKTPLQILSGTLHMLRESQPSPEQAQMLIHAESAAQRLIRLVQDLLDLTALQQGTLTIHAEPMDLGAHLRALIADFETQAKAKGLVFRVQQASLCPSVICDGPRLTRALASLLENALRFTDAGAVDICWKVNHENGTCRLQFEVADAGPGLPADWPRLLQPFEQAANHGHRVPGGLGLGLPLAAGQLRAMGGTLGLRPGPVGTLAWAAVPLKEHRLG